MLWKTHAFNVDEIDDWHVKKIKWLFLLSFSLARVLFT